MTTLSLKWEKPQARANEVVGYIVDVKRLQQRASNREVESVALLGRSFDKEVEGLQTTVVGLGKLHDIVHQCIPAHNHHNNIIIIIYRERNSIQCHSEGCEPCWLWGRDTNLLLYTGRRWVFILVIYLVLWLLNLQFLVSLAM